MRQVDRFVVVSDADMHMLAKHRELLGEIAVGFVDAVEAFALRDLAQRPVAERMRPAATETDVQPGAFAPDGARQRQQVRFELRGRTVHRAVQFDHRLGDLGLDPLVIRTAAEPTQHRRRH
jgi:hypothetical protein